MKKLIFSLTLVLALSASASACPMCKVATEDTASASSDPNAALQPKAYAASIAFMLAVPAAIFSTLGYGLYRMSKAESQALTRNENNQPIE